jgi:hypothetical protein
MSLNRNHSNERIVQLLYRRLKNLPLTIEEDQEVKNWLDRSEGNRRVFESLSDEEWLTQARKKYYAPGKEAGLQQLREQLFADLPDPKPWYRRWFWGLLDFIVPASNAKNL